MAWIPGSCSHSHCSHPPRGPPACVGANHLDLVGVFCPPPGGLLQDVSAQETAKSPSCGGGRGLQTRRARSSAQAPSPAPCGPRPKPKTVSELLREKRLREARARKAAQGPVALQPQVLVSSSVILQSPLPLASHSGPATGLAIPNSAFSGPGAPAAASPSTPGVWASARDTGPAALQALAIAPVSSVAVKTPAASQVPLSCQLSSLGQSQAPATSRKQGLPEAPPFLPAAPSPTQLPVQPLSLTPALGAHSGGPHVAASAPLPVTLVLTAQGLLSVPVPAVVGLSKPAGTPDPKGLLVTLSSPSVTETQAGQGLVSTGSASEPPSRTDLVTPPTPLPPQSPAEVHSVGACAPGGPPAPGEAQVAGETASQAALLADDPEARPSQLPAPRGAGPENGPVGTAGSASEPGETRGPPDLERHPPPRLGPEKGTLDLGLLSQESEVAVREWLRGQRGVCTPPLRSRLPYQPPSLCSLRALSGLLLHKKTLERRAASLAGPGGSAGALEASRGQLQRSPAYLLLKARFLAAFTLPALLATLPPRGVSTTLSAAVSVDTESEGAESDGDSLGRLELPDGHGQPGRRASSCPQEGPAATASFQVGGRGAEPSARFPCLPTACGLPRVAREGLGTQPVEVAAGTARWRVSGEEEAGSQPARWHVRGTTVASLSGQCGNWGRRSPVSNMGRPSAAPWAASPAAVSEGESDVGSVLPPTHTHAPQPLAWARSPAENGRAHACLWAPRSLQVATRAPSPSGRFRSCGDSVLDPVSVSQPKT